MANNGPKTGTPARTPAKPTSKPVAKPEIAQAAKATITPVTKMAAPESVAKPFAPAKPAPASAAPVKAAAPVQVASPVKAAAPAEVAAPVKAVAPVEAPAPALPVTPVEPPVLVQPAAAKAPEPVIQKVAEVAVKTPEKPKPAAAVQVAIMQKEMNTMESSIKNAADKTQAYFAEANDRAKAAMEKSAKAFEDINEFGKGNIEAFVESGKIAAKGIESLGQEAAEYSRKQFEGATAALKNLSSVKSPTDFFKLQSDYVRQSFDAIVAQASKNTEAMLKLAGEVAQPISNRVAVAVEKVKIAA
jgi:phasin family protein